MPGLFSAATGVCSLIALSVMSASGVAFRCVTLGDAGDELGFRVDSDPTSDGVFSASSGSGESEGSGVGKDDGSSSGIGFEAGAIDVRAFLFARILCLPPAVRFLGEAFFTGDNGSVFSAFSVASNISEGSIVSVARDLRVRPPVRGVAGSSAVFRLVPRVVLAGAGVNSSSLSLLVSGVWSSSSDSSMIFFLAAALLDGRVGETADMFGRLAAFALHELVVSRLVVVVFMRVNNALRPVLRVTTVALAPYMQGRNRSKHASFDDHDHDLITGFAKGVQIIFPEPLIHLSIPPWLAVTIG